MKVSWLTAHLRRVREVVVTGLFIFWCIQFVGWMLMMFVVEVDPKPFTQSLLYTIQISHWALVESAGTAAIGAWALVQAKHNSRQINDATQRLDHIHDHVDPDASEPTSKYPPH